MPRRVFKGVVVSDKNDKTVVVRVEKSTKHPIYKKYIKKSAKYAAHDPLNTFKIGDTVEIIESKPISKSKHWHVILDDKIDQV